MSTYIRGTPYQRNDFFLFPASCLQPLITNFRRCLQINCRNKNFNSYVQGSALKAKKYLTSQTTEGKDPALGTTTGPPLWHCHEPTHEPPTNPTCLMVFTFILNNVIIYGPRNMNYFFSQKGNPPTNGPPDPPRCYLSNQLKHQCCSGSSQTIHSGQHNPPLASSHWTNTRAASRDQPQTLILPESLPIYSNIYEKKANIVPTQTEGHINHCL